MAECRLGLVGSPQWRFTKVVGISVPVYDQLTVIADGLVFHREQPILKSFIKY
jgi:hypothetical protein